MPEAPTPTVAAAPAVTGKPAKRKPAPRAVAGAKKVQLSSDKPVTIRQRILNLLATGPRSARQIARGLNLEPRLAGQHCYLIKRDGLITMDDSDVYSLVDK